MPTFNIHEAKSQLSKLVKLAEDGEEVTIARDGVPVVQLTAIAALKAKPRMFGQYRGLANDDVIDAAFSKEAESEVLDAFSDSASKPMDFSLKASAAE